MSDGSGEDVRQVNVQSGGFAPRLPPNDNTLVGDTPPTAPKTERSGRGKPPRLPAKTVAAYGANHSFVRGPWGQPVERACANGAPSYAGSGSDNR